jgi:hypothetical protein
MVLPCGVRAGNLLAKALTRQLWVFSSRYKSVSGEFIASFPGQKGQEGKKAGLSGLGSACTKSLGLLALSLAMITHSLVVGSCLISDIFLLLA